MKSLIPILLVSCVVLLGACETTTERVANPAVFGSSNRSSQINRPPAAHGEAESSGWWDRMADKITERECDVSRFTCPYGIGPAGEPCDCTDARGVVRQGITIK